jgi:hypothetical protein
VPRGSLRSEHGHEELDGLWDRVTILSSQNGNGPLTGGLGPGKKFFQVSKLHSKLQIQKGSLPLLQKYSNFDWVLGLRQVSLKRRHFSLHDVHGWLQTFLQLQHMGGVVNCS